MEQKRKCATPETAGYRERRCSGSCVAAGIVRCFSESCVEPITFTKMSVSFWERHKFDILKRFFGGFCAMNDVKQLVWTRLLPLTANLDEGGVRKLAFSDNCTHGLMHFLTRSYLWKKLSCEIDSAKLSNIGWEIKAFPERFLTTNRTIFSQEFRRICSATRKHSNLRPNEESWWLKTGRCSFN